MKPLFPYFGGKSQIAPKIWDHLGNVGSYVEPFFGSGAVLAARPHTGPHVELVGDMNGWLVNAWRSVKHSPSEVAEHISNLSYSEADLRAAKILVYNSSLQDKLESDVDWCDPKIGAYWLCIMSGLFANSGSNNNSRGSLEVGSAPSGVFSKSFRPIYLNDWCKRMKNVKILSGDWRRTISSRSKWQMDNIGGRPVGVYLDPPYADGDRSVYGEDHTDEPALASAQWAIEHGNDPRMRIIYSGYEGTVEFPDSWRVIKWKTFGGFGNIGNGNGTKNKNRERLWLSPHCLHDIQCKLL